MVGGPCKIREKIVREASGHVLESAVGTGRNGEWYSRLCTERAAAAALAAERKGQAKQRRTRRDGPEEGLARPGERHDGGCQRGYAGRGAREVGSASWRHRRTGMRAACP